MIKVLYYKNHLRIIGGIERIWINRMNYLSEDPDYQIYIATNAQENVEPVFPISKRVKLIDLDVCTYKSYSYPIILRPFIKVWKNLLFYKRFQKIIDQINPDFIVIDSTYDPMIFRVSHHAKIIAESHVARSFSHYEREHAEQLFNDFEKKADVVVSLTISEAKEWHKAKQVRIIPNFIEKQPLPTFPKQEFKRVISSGRLVVQKRQDDLIKAWKNVVKKHPDWMLDIYGAGEKLDSLQSLIISYGLQNCIHILPPTDRMFEEFKSSDFLVMSSLYEGFSLVIAEAMMMGTPCVSYDCPYGPSDLIDNTHNGLLTPSGDIMELSNAINWMIEHPEQRDRMGRDAYQSIQRYTPEHVIPKWKSLFRN